MRRVGLLLLLILPSLAWGQRVTLPAEVKGDPGTIVIVRADTDCANLQWVALDQGLSLIPPELLKDSRTAVVMSGRAGRYRLLAYGAKGDVASQPAICSVVIGEAPIPPGPGPGPVDPLTVSFQSAYDTEASPDKATHLKGLAEVFAAVPAQIAAAQSLSQLASAVRTATNAVIGSDSLPKVRAKIGSHLAAVLGTADRPLDDALRKTVAAEYAKVAAALKGVR